MRRVAVLGLSCSGKSTLARRLAPLLGVPHIELDALVHGQNWEETPNDVLQERVAGLVAADGWIVDGNYLSKLGDLVLDRADTAIVMHPPFRTSLGRAVARSARRVVTREELWNGNRETLRDAVGRYSIVRYVAGNHGSFRDKIMSALERHPHLDVVELSTPGDADRFVQSIQAMPSTSGSSNGSERQKTPPSVET